MRMKYNIFILGFLLIVSFPLIIFPATVNAEIHVYCEESSYTIGRNENVTIPIKISGVTSLRGFSIAITYDTNYLTSVPSDLSEEDFLSNSGDPTQWYVAGSDGNYTATCAILGVTNGSSGSGTLFSINLTGLSPTTGGAEISIGSIILRDVMNEMIVVDNVNGSIVNVDCPVYADVTLFLEGAYNEETHCMTTLLHNSIPLNSPYNDAITVASIPDCVVDWVFVELRSCLTGTPLCAKSMFLKSDGHLCDPYYDHPGFANLECGCYYVVIKHRNHLAVISSNTCQFTDEGSIEDLDLTTESNIYGNSGVIRLEENTCGICCGDIDGDCELSTTDYVQWFNAFFLGSNGYNSSDVNLDGVTTTADYTKWYNNYIKGAHSCVPEP